MDITRVLANHAIELSFESLPEDVIEASKKVILDTLGSTLAGTTADGIDTIRVKVNQSTFNLVCSPLESKKRPSTIAEAQFSLPYCVAVAMDKGDVFLDDFLPEAIQRKGVLAISGSVFVEVDEAIERRAGRHIGPAELEIITHDGHRYTADVEFVKGHPKNPMTTAEVEKKFTKCAAFAAKPISSENLSEVKRIVSELERYPDVSQIMAFLR
jgi:2-methylcitrate dehydratase PrpD